MFERFSRSSTKTSLAHEDGRYIVRFTDGNGKAHEDAFGTKREARFFAREIGKWPADQPFDRKELARLSAEYTGSFTRNVGQHYGILPPK